MTHDEWMAGRCKVCLRLEATQENRDRALWEAARRAAFEEAAEAVDARRNVFFNRVANGEYDADECNAKIEELGKVARWLVTKAKSNQDGEERRA